MQIRLSSHLPVSRRNQIFAYSEGGPPLLGRRISFLGLGQRAPRYSPPICTNKSTGHKYGGRRRRLGFGRWRTACPRVSQRPDVPTAPCNAGNGRSEHNAMGQLGCNGHTKAGFDYLKPDGLRLWGSLNCGCKPQNGPKKEIRQKARWLSSSPHVPLSLRGGQQETKFGSAQ